MKKILLIITVAMTMSSIALYADNGKKPFVKKNVRVESRKKKHSTHHSKLNCPNRPGCICH